MLATVDVQVADVRATLQAFQDGYVSRDRNAIDTFMHLFTMDANLEVIGTSASARSEDEWCIGQAAARNLILLDWQFWGDLVLDVVGAHIHILGPVAWLSTTGTVAQTIPLAKRYTDIAAYLQGTLHQQADLDIQRELFTVILGAASALANARTGEHYVWPIRFTAVLVQQQGQWQFHQIHFSYPTVHDPNVRIV